MRIIRHVGVDMISMVISESRNGYIEEKKGKGKKSSYISYLSDDGSAYLIIPSGVNAKWHVMEELNCEQKRERNGEKEKKTRSQLSSLNETAEIIAVVYKMKGTSF